MKQIHNKLHSQSGASLVLAMVFLLFCTLIGGSILASATVNTRRAEETAQQQDFLLARSAALLLSDLLQPEEGQYLRLQITDSLDQIQEVSISGTGQAIPTGQSQTRRVITFRVSSDGPVTQMQQLLLEATVYRYLLECAPDHNYDELRFVCFPGDPLSLSDFLFRRPVSGEIRGSISVSPTVYGGSGVAIPSYTINFSSEAGYDFRMDFGEYDHFRILMKAYSGVSDPIMVVSPATVGKIQGDTDPTGHIQITSLTGQVTVSWEDPLVDKGGSQ